MPIILIAVITSILVSSIFIVLLIYFQANINYLFGVEITDKNSISIVKDIITPLSASLGGASVGALLAFYIQNKKEEKKARESEVMALNLTAFALESQLNDLAMIKKQSVIPLKDSPLRFAQIQPMAALDHVEERVNISFAPALLALKKPDLIQKIKIAEKRYLNVINILKRRDAIKIQVDYATQAAGINIFDKFGLKELYSIIGPNSLALLYRMTEDYILSLDDSIESLMDVGDELSDILLEHYKDVGISKLQLSLPEEEKYILNKMPLPVIANEKDLLIKAGYTI